MPCNEASHTPITPEYQRKEKSRKGNNYEKCLFAIYIPCRKCMQRSSSYPFVPLARSYVLLVQNQCVQNLWVALLC